MLFTFELFQRKALYTYLLWLLNVRYRAAYYYHVMFMTRDENYDKIVRLLETCNCSIMSPNVFSLIIKSNDETVLQYYLEIP